VRKREEEEGEEEEEEGPDIHIQTCQMVGES